jgi:hypothetical protein
MEDSSRGRAFSSTRSVGGGASASGDPAGGLDEPQARDGLPECPPELTAKQVRAYTLDQFADLRVLTPADRDGLAASCKAVATHREAGKEGASTQQFVPIASGGL